MKIPTITETQKIAEALIAKYRSNGEVMRISEDSLEEGVFDLDMLIYGEWNEYDGGSYHIKDGVLFNCGDEMCKVNEI